MWTRIKNKFYKYPALAIPVMIILCLLIPLATGLWTVISNPWVPLPPPPSRAEKLLGTMFDRWNSRVNRVVIVGDNGLEYVGGHVYVLAENGQVYTYDLIARMWRESLEELVANREICDKTTLDLTLYLKRGQCVQGEEYYYYNAFYAYHRFLLDRDGNLWYREDRSGDFFPYYILFCACSGLVAGMLVTLILARLSKRKESPGWIIKLPLKDYLTNLRWPILISTLLVLPIMLLELVNRWRYHEGFPIPLFVLLWLLWLGFTWFLMSIVRDIRAGNKIKPIGLILRVVLLILIAWLWVAIIFDQIPCFLGVPNCD